MRETVNRKQLAEAQGVSLPTIDAWVRRGCPVVTRGGPGRPWEFDASAVAAWCDRYLSRGSRVVSRGAAHRFASVEQAEVVKALGHIVRHVGRVAADMAVKAGATVPVAYALDQMVCLRVSDVAEAYLAEHGVRGIELVEAFCRPGDEPDWQALAEEAGSTFDEDACEKHLNGIEWLKTPLDVLEAQAAWFRERGHE